VIDVNGKTLGLIDAIRAADGLAGRVDAGTPLIVLTAGADELHRIRVRDRGSDDVLTKPYSISNSAPGGPLCLAVPAPATRHGFCASASWRSTLPHGPWTSTGPGSSCLARNTNY
jgi:CheY-like chemotaxis protein